jgi:hypothetical protein
MDSNIRLAKLELEKLKIQQQIELLNCEKKLEEEIAKVGIRKTQQREQEDDKPQNQRGPIIIDLVDDHVKNEETVLPVNGGLPNVNPSYPGNAAQRLPIITSASTESATLSSTFSQTSTLATPMQPNPQYPDRQSFFGSLAGNLSVTTHICSRCLTTEASSWYHEPDGRMSCGACGQYFRRTGRQRPATLFKYPNYKGFRGRPGKQRATLSATSRVSKRTATAINGFLDSSQQDRSTCNDISIRSMTLFAY